MTRILRWVLVAWCAFLALPSAGAVLPGVVIEPTEPSRFRFARAPQVVVFAPGNQGDLVWRDPPRPDPGNTDRLGEWACDGSVLSLVEEGYAWLPVEDAASTGSVQSYWERLRSVVASASSMGAVADLRLTVPLLDLLERAGPDAPAWFAQQAALALDQLPCPLFSVDAEPDDPRVPRLVEALRRSLPMALVGGVVGEGDPFPLAGSWDFFIARPEAAPPPFGGQPAAAWLRHRAGGRPVVLLCAQPEFRPAMFWMATGAAGLQFDALPLPGSFRHRTAAQDMRAISQLRWRFGGGAPFRVADGLRGGGAHVALAGANRVLYLLGGAGEPAAVDIPLVPGLPGYIATWYNPELDEHIILPAAPVPPGPLEITPPDSAPWVFAVDLVTRTESEMTPPPMVAPENQ